MKDAVHELNEYPSYKSNFKTSDKMAQINGPQSHNMGKESYLLNIIMPIKI
jgi:hypothetical protein